jgi:RNA polymerase sigma-70 factor, ECF subfamily
VRAGSEPLTGMYDRYYDAAYGLALKVLHDPSLAEDVVQECFLKLWRNSDRFDATRGSLRSWVLRAVRNQSIDYLRGRHAYERRELEISADSPAQGDGSDPWREVAALVDRATLQQALASLPAEQREAVRLAYFEGYRHPEIARLQGVPLSTVKGRIRLGIRKLHLYMQERGLVFGAAHDAIQSRIAPYLAGESRHGESEVMQTHLEMCASCRQLARQMTGGPEVSGAPAPPAESNGGAPR